MNKNSIQRIWALVKHDAHIFSIYFIIYAAWQLIATLNYKSAMKWDIDNNRATLDQLAGLYGTVNLPTNDPFFIILIGMMLYITYIKFSNKKLSQTYRLLPATTWEKCMNVVADMFAMIFGAYIIKAIYCIIFGLWIGGADLSGKALMGMWFDHAPDYGYFGVHSVTYNSYHYTNEVTETTTIAPTDSTNADSTLSTTTTKSNESYSMCLMGSFIEAEIGIPVNTDYSNYNCIPFSLQQSLVNSQYSQSVQSYVFLRDWRPYPMLAFGVNLASFLFSTLMILLVISIFGIKRVGQSIFRTLGAYIIYIFFAYFLILIFLSQILSLPWDSDILGLLNNIGYIPSIILTATGQWCWASMYGWVVQCAILLIFNLLAIHYMYKKIKNL